MPCVGDGDLKWAVLGLWGSRSNWQAKKKPISQMELNRKMWLTWLTKPFWYVASQRVAINYQASKSGFVMEESVPAFSKFQTWSLTSLFNCLPWPVGNVIRMLLCYLLKHAYHAIFCRLLVIVKRAFLTLEILPSRGINNISIAWKISL